VRDEATSGASVRAIHTARTCSSKQATARYYTSSLEATLLGLEAAQLYPAFAARRRRSGKGEKCIVAQFETQEVFMYSSESNHLCQSQFACTTLARFKSARSVYVLVIKQHFLSKVELDLYLACSSADPYNRPHPNHWYHIKKSIHITHPTVQLRVRCPPKAPVWFRAPGHHAPQAGVAERESNEKERKERWSSGVHQIMTSPHPYSPQSYQKSHSRPTR